MCSLLRLEGTPVAHAPQKPSPCPPPDPPRGVGLGSTPELPGTRSLPCSVDEGPPSPFSHSSPRCQQRPPSRSRNKCLALLTGARCGRFPRFADSHLGPLTHSHRLLGEHQLPCGGVGFPVLHQEVKGGVGGSGRDEQSQEQRKNRATPQFCPASSPPLPPAPPRLQWESDASSRPSQHNTHPSSYTWSPASPAAPHAPFPAACAVI